MNTFSDTLNTELGQPTRNKNINKEKFPNLFGSRAGQNIETALHMGVDYGVMHTGEQVSEVIDEKLIQDTRDARDKAMASIARLEEQSVISAKIAKQMKIQANPNHYGKKRKPVNKLHKPARFFGNSKDVVYMEIGDEVKAMTLKTAHKKGLI